MAARSFFLLRTQLNSVDSVVHTRTQFIHSLRNFLQLLIPFHLSLLLIFKGSLQIRERPLSFTLDWLSRQKARGQKESQTKECQSSLSIEEAASNGQSPRVCR